VDHKYNHPANIFHRKPPRNSVFIAMLIIILGLSFVLCTCSHTVDISMPAPGDQTVSAQGTCVACHSSDKMINLTAIPIQASADTGEG
jgi:hypothetical protein